MIQALDHIVLAASSLAEAEVRYTTLLGRRVAAHGGDADPWFQLSNAALRLMPANSTGGELAAVVLRAQDLASCERLLRRRALPQLVRDCRSCDASMLPLAATHGVAIGFVQREWQRPVSELAGSDSAAAIDAIDHVVIRTPNPDRALVLYGARLGLDLRLDITRPEWGARLLFFRCGDLVLELAHDLKAGISDGPDRLWGISWRVNDIDACHTGLRVAGLKVSEVRPGRRPGTRVFSVRSGTCEVPTLIIGRGKLADATKKEARSEGEKTRGD